METDKFIISRVEWTWNKSREIPPSAPVRGLPRQFTVECKSCGEAWVARSHGRGAFTKALFNVAVTCPACGENEAISTSSM